MRFFAVSTTQQAPVLNANATNELRYPYSLSQAHQATAQPFTDHVYGEKNHHNNLVVISKGLYPFHEKNKHNYHASHALEFTILSLIFAFNRDLLLLSYS